MTHAHATPCTNHLITHHTPLLRNYGHKRAHTHTRPRKKRKSSTLQLAPGTQDPLQAPRRENHAATGGGGGAAAALPGVAPPRLTRSLARASSRRRVPRDGNDLASTPPRALCSGASASRPAPRYYRPKQRQRGAHPVYIPAHRAGELGIPRES